MIYKTDLFYIWLVVSTPLKKSQLGLLFPIYINILYYMEVNKKCSKPPTSDSKCASKRLILTLQQSSIFPSKTIYLNSSSFFSMSRIGKKNTQNLNFHGTPPVDSLETCQRDHGENMISSGVQQIPSRNQRRQNPPTSSLHTGSKEFPVHGLRFSSFLLSSIINHLVGGAMCPS